jgi:hypothetical protein
LREQRRQRTQFSGQPMLIDNNDVEPDEEIGIEPRSEGGRDGLLRKGSTLPFIEVFFILFLFFIMDLNNDFCHFN